MARLTIGGYYVNRTQPDLVADINRAEEVTLKVTEIETQSISIELYSRISIIMNGADILYRARYLDRPAVRSVPKLVYKSLATIRGSHACMFSEMIVLWTSEFAKHEFSYI